jgi:hypothetical protein
VSRIRSIKPEFFLHEELANLPPLHRLLFVGLWTLADREGRLEDRPRRIKVEILPYDDCNADQMLHDLDAAGFIVRYATSDGRNAIAIPGFKTHQMPHYKEAPSSIPPPSNDNSTLTQRQPDVEPTSTQPYAVVDLTLPTGREGKGREGSRKGKESATSTSADVDPLFARWSQGYESSTGKPYVHQKRDFVQLSSLRRQLPDPEIAERMARCFETRWCWRDSAMTLAQFCAQAAKFVPTKSRDGPGVTARVASHAEFDADPHDPKEPL